MTRRLMLMRTDVMRLGMMGSRNLAPLVTIPPVQPPVNSTLPSITPSTGILPGVLLTCNPGVWSNSPAYSYQWLADGTVIPGATNSTYTVVALDIAATISCEVRGTNAAGTAVATSAPVGPVQAPLQPPVNTAPPTITPTTGIQPGVVLACSTGTWSNNPTSFAYQWFTDGVAVAGATSATYTVVSLDVGADVTCRVTATNAAGSTPIDTAPVGPVAPVAQPPSNLTLPTVTFVGSLYPRKVLTCLPGTWANSPTSYEYQWYANGAAIPGEDQSTYTVTAADIGKAIRCGVMAVNPAGASGEAYSDATPNVLWSPDALGSALLYWFSPDDPATVTIVNNTVTELRDKGPNGWHVSNNIAAQQPTLVANGLNGRAVLAMNAQCLYRLGGINIPANTEIQFFIVASFGSLSASSARIFTHGPAAANDRSTNSFCPATRTGTGSVLTASTSSGFNVQYGNNLAFDRYVLGTASRTATVLAASGDGDGTSEYTLPIAVPLANLVNLGIGISFGTTGIGTPGTVGNLFECFGMNRLATLAEMQRAEGYLAWRAGLQTRLPITHPYCNAHP